MIKSEFSKHWSFTGFTWDEAEIKKKNVNEAHNGGLPNSRWNEADIVADPRGGYKVVICTKD